MARNPTRGELGSITIVCVNYEFRVNLYIFFTLFFVFFMLCLICRRTSFVSLLSMTLVLPILLCKLYYHLMNKYFIKVQFCLVFDFPLYLLKQYLF